MTKRGRKEAHRDGPPEIPLQGGGIVDAGLFDPENVAEGDPVMLDGFIVQLNNDSGPHYYHAEIELQYRHGSLVPNAQYGLFVTRSDYEAVHRDGTCIAGLALQPVVENDVLRWELLLVAVEPDATWQHLAPVKALCDSLGIPCQ